MKPGTAVAIAGYSSFFGYVGASFIIGDMDSKPPIAWIIGLLATIVVVAAGIVIEEYKR
jgi:hypothetical protein